MTPELRKACELVFQEHKASAKPINWNKDPFLGRLSFGQAVMARETLEKRNIICPFNPTKKTVTVLNPAAATAAGFEEAGRMIDRNIQVLVSNSADDEPAYITHHVTGFTNTIAANTDKLQKIRISSKTTPTITKEWKNSLFVYIIWVVCAAAAGGLITYLLGLLI